MPARRREPLAREEPAELQVAATNGSIVTDSRGRKYIDFVMGWCVGNFGWRPAAIAKAIERFKGPDYVYPGYAYAPWTELARLLTSLAPRPLTTWDPAFSLSAAGQHLFGERNGCFAIPGFVVPDINDDVERAGVLGADEHMLDPKAREEEMARRQAVTNYVNAAAIATKRMAISPRAARSSARASWSARLPAGRSRFGSRWR